MIAISAFAVAAAAGPAFAATMISTAAPQDYQAYPGECLAWFGNKEDGKCLSYSNGQPINAGTPDSAFTARTVAASGSAPVHCCPARRSTGPIG